MKKTNTDWIKKLEKEAKKIGAVIHTLEVEVDYSKTHEEVVRDCVPNTPENYDVFKVSSKYKPSANKKVTEVIVLLNYPHGGGNYEKTVEWGLQHGLQKTTPHVPFSVGKHHPKLNYELGQNSMYVVETTGCEFEGNLNACFVWWDDANREAYLHWQCDFGYSDDWFAFRKVLGSKTLETSDTLSLESLETRVSNIENKLRELSKI